MIRSVFPDLSRRRWPSSKAFTAYDVSMSLLRSLKVPDRYFGGATARFSVLGRTLYLDELGVIPAIGKRGVNGRAVRPDAVRRHIEGHRFSALPPLDTMDPTD